MKAVVRCTAAAGAVLTVEADTNVKARSHGRQAGIKRLSAATKSSFMKQGVSP